MWEIGDYGYFSISGISAFRIENIFDDKITIKIFPISFNSIIPWGIERTYAGEFRNNLKNRVDGEYHNQIMRMFFDHIFRN